jgi:hypothetical protein
MIEFKDTYDVRDLAERLLLNVCGRLVLASPRVDLDELEWSLRLLEHDHDPHGAGRVPETVELEDHDEG